MGRGLCRQVAEGVSVKASQVRWALWASSVGLVALVAFAVHRGGLARAEPTALSKVERNLHTMRLVVEMHALDHQGKLPADAHAFVRAMKASFPLGSGRLPLAPGCSLGQSQALTPRPGGPNLDLGPVTLRQDAPTRLNDAWAIAYARVDAGYYRLTVTLPHQGRAIQHELNDPWPPR